MSYLNLIYGPDCKFNTVYGSEPGRLLEPVLDQLSAYIEGAEKFQKLLVVKLENYCRKLLMMHTAGDKALDSEREFIVTQDRTYPTLIWDEEIELLYHLEALILFGRSALDLAAYVFGTFLLPPFGQNRFDSFNEFAKKLLKSEQVELVDLQIDLKALEDVRQGWFRLLCGTEKGRSLRDQVAHQTIVRIEYLETKPTSDKEYCHVILFNEIAVPLEDFVNNLRAGVVGFCLKAERTIATLASRAG